MTTSTLRAVALTSAFVLLASPVAAQDDSGATPTSAPKAITTLGCYNHPDPLTVQGNYDFQSSGYCQTQCVTMNKPVMAITGGSTCYCGDEIPALDQEVDQDKCDTVCAGYGLSTCGGIGYWQVYLTGLTGDVETAPNSTSSTSSSSPQGTAGSGSTSTQPAVVTQPGQTVVVTQSASALASQDKSSGGSNKVAIAVGVVVGIVGLAGIIGGVLLYMRHKRNREIEEEHRRNAAVSSFVGSAASDKSSTDQRLDPSIYSHRRQSIGSIADERDFSRRILQVC
ncbi:hypothetical protein G647_04356 [Cladophialophora carrionii CBS 160.54]|uniref:WSC domain-containing protein n=1 Tax=Cladophialophora carrionii CBS 160.54 TaxID=1279043 RepID=V9DE92_9EURO|nr:uncharacterized protein G647_04356 [Cladophialophora carrionii CBS 160.54]ETI24986.1 hypothetical protein G647_04356 [Cladophialophora carrionii CBS 160.54]